ncbi:P-loop containing nucleoside triphosphate hydrolase protein [Wallemia mellicola]|nr:P-loop containing nucleoside triphosphate hydrolase protein [Wallemia mellicola]
MKRLTHEGGSFIEEQESPRKKQAKVEPVEEDELGDEFEDDFDTTQIEMETEQIVRRKSTKGSVADAGIIQYVEVYNFMCHKYLACGYTIVGSASFNSLTVDLGPQLNFIIGHNGSGKSAILTAITLALGGRATATNRGSTLKSFIKSGQTSAQIVLKLKNEGTEAYKPSVYGSTIIVERTVKDNGNSLKLKSSSGKTVSTTRQELTAICDHFMIQVDNPMNVLSQDQARQFLSASHAKEKYEFFLKGTQLTQLSDEYQLISENISNARDATVRKKERLPALEEAASRAHTRYKEATKARDQQHKLLEFKNELAWSVPAAIEKDINEEEKGYEVARQRMVAIEEALQAAEMSYQETQAEVDRYESMTLNEDSQLNYLRSEKEKINEILKDHKLRLQNNRKEEADLNQYLNEIQSSIQDFENQKKEEFERLKIDYSAQHAETRKQMEELHEQIQVHNQIDTESDEKINEGREQIGELQNKYAEIKRQKATCEANIQQSQQELMQINASLKDRKAAFGNKMPAILQEIDNQTWIEKPIGPLGRYVKLTDNRWSKVLESVLGGTLNAFACTNLQDRRKLLGILKRNGASSGVIQMGEKSFDFSAGEPSSEFVTIDRVLKFDREEVRCILVNQNRSESSILVRDRQDADQIMRTHPHNVTSCYVLNGLFQVGGGVGSATITLQQYKGAPRLTTDTSEAKKLAEESMAEARKQYQELQKEELTVSKEIEDIRKNADRYKSDKDRAYREKRNCEYQINQLRETLQSDQPVNIAAIDAAIEEQKEEITKVQQQYAAIATKQHELQQYIQPHLEHNNDIKQQLADYDKTRLSIEANLKDAHDHNNQAMTTLNHRRKQKQQESVKVDAYEQHISKIRSDLEIALEQASEICSTRIMTTRSVNEIQRDIQGIEVALRARQERNGSSIEAVTTEYHKALDAVESAQRDINDMNIFIRELKKALDLRTQKWLQFRKHIAMRAKYQFMFHLSSRGYYGTIHFNHGERRLDLMVQTDDQLATQGKRDKDPRSLSGGEKSFSTICLLLSLWEAIGCPIRCLDEFDVFMDAVNRKISMKMMIDTAKSSTGIQYVLITPQDMSSITLGKEVKVHRMKDPERSTAS